MKQEYRVKDIYVCYIAYQSVVGEKIDGFDYYYAWTYDPNTIKIALCTKTLKGYKHILSNNVYPIASYKTGNQFTISKKGIVPWLKYDDNIGKILVKRGYNSNFNMPLSLIEKFEEKYNNQLDFSADNVLLAMK